MKFEKDSQARPGIKTFLGWVRDSYEFFADHRAEQWRDEEMYDGVQWTPAQIQTLKDVLGMQAITINRTFPTINMLLGMQVLGQTDIIAKGRTVLDTDISHLASESLKFVVDQNEGTSKINAAFRGAVIPGFGGIEVVKNSDPRKELIKLANRDWKYTWWDPNGTPWFDSESTRYLFMQRWVNLHDVLMLFPNKAKEIEGFYYSSAADTFGFYPRVSSDSIWQPLESKGEFWNSSLWADKPRKRVLPTQMWYTVRQELTFATFPDGRAFELNALPIEEQIQLVTQCQEVVKGYVPKMRVATFVGNVLLQDVPSPHGHDEFPLVPFVGYEDRYKRPYGVPRQIRDMDIETNKRRTTALAKLNAKRIIVEDGAVEDLAVLRQEAMRADGMIVIGRGKRVGEHIAIQDQDSEMRGQIELLRESEREISEIVGAVAEQMGYESNAISGKAIEKRQQRGATITASLFENLKRSKKRLGFLIMCAIQEFWKREKVIRVTDRFKGTDKLITINQTETDAFGRVSVKNRLTDIKFDIVVADDVFSDVLREKYAEILIESTKRAAPEAVPLILDVAFEMLDMPRKEFVLMRLRQAFNLDIPPDEDLDKEEIAKKIQEQKAEAAEVAKRAQNLQFETEELKNEKLIAQIRKLLSQAQIADRQVERNEVDTQIALSKSDRDDEAIALEVLKNQQKLDIESAKLAVNAAKMEGERDKRPRPETKEKGGK